MRHKSKRIVFLTTSIGSKWICFQQQLLKQFYPHSLYILINGNLHWDYKMGKKATWYKFIDKAINTGCKYFIHIDEDCFMLNNILIEECISLLESDKYDLIGPNEVIEGFRFENPYALNSFFMVGKIASLEDIWKNFDFNLKFTDLNLDKDFRTNSRSFELEPYYNFFWNYYKQGYKIGNVKTSFNEKFKCTELLDSSRNISGFHLWFTRCCNSNEEIYGMTHRNRYNKTAHFIRSNKSLKNTSFTYAQLIPIRFTYFYKNFIYLFKKL